MTVSIALIWGSHRRDPLFHTHHSFWEETILARADLKLLRYTWEDWLDMPKNFDLYFFLDFHPSLFRLPSLKLRNTAFYWWDSFHYPISYPAQITPLFDRAYFAERLTADYLTYMKIPAMWLPASFYPDLYRPIPDIKKVHDYGFVGQQDGVVLRKGATRADFLRRLAKAHNLHGYVGLGVYGEEVNRIYNESAVLFDRTIFLNLGTRFFETIGSGGFLLMNRTGFQNGMDDLAKDGVHYVSYDDSYEDFEKKVRHYVDRPDERIPIAENGYRHFLENHTYGRRLEKILSDFQLT